MPTWIGSTGQEWTDPAQWDTGVPVDEDDALITGGNDCTLDDHTADLANLTCDGSFSGNFDCDVHNLTVTGGGVTLAGTGIFDLGTGTTHRFTNCNFDNSAQGTMTPGSSDVVMAGTGSITSASNKPLYDLTIAAAATITVMESVFPWHDVDVQGAILISAGKTLLVGGDITIGAAGRIGGAGTCQLYLPVAGEGITSIAAGATVDVAKLYVDRPDVASVMAPGTYAAGLFRVYVASSGAYTWTPSATPTTPYTFGGNVTYEANHASADLTIACNTNDPTITIVGTLAITCTNGLLTYLGGSGDTNIGGNLTLTETAGTLTYTKSATGRTRLNGTDPTLTSIGKVMEAIVVACSGTFTHDALTCDGLRIASGTWDPGAVDVTIQNGGDFSIDPGAAVNVTNLDGRTITVDGDVTLRGAPGSPLDLAASDDWNIDCDTGEIRAYYCNLEYCQLGVGQTGIAYNCGGAREADGGTNDDGWEFTTLPAGQQGTRSGLAFWRQSMIPQ